MPRPYVVKPINEGSSVGVRIVRERRQPRRRSTAASWPFGEQVLVERFIPGRELTVAVMGDRALGGHRAAARTAASTTTRPNTPTAAPSI